jgi:predicted RND superfamily exporter protein
VKHHVSIVIICVLLSLFSALGIFQLKTETNLIEYFRKTSDIYQSTAFIEKNLSGITFVDISLESKISDIFTDPHILGKIEFLEHHLKSYAQVDKVTSINTYLREMNKAFHNEDDNYYKLPQSQDVISQYFLLFDHEELKSFIDSNYRWTRISARVTEHNSNKLRELISSIELYAVKNFGKNVAVQVTGNAVLESNLIEQVVASQTGSLALAAVTVFTLVFLMLRSVKLGMISIVPNVLPQVINFGIMGWAGIPLNTATAMIAAIATGIVVDDTIHFLSTFSEEEQRCRDYRQAIRCTILAKGSAVITASVVLFFGFGVLILSHFVPTSYFGILSAVTMGTALLGDLFLLPTLLLLFEPILRRQLPTSPFRHSQGGVLSPYRQKPFGTDRGRSTLGMYRLCRRIRTKKGV